MVAKIYLKGVIKMQNPEYEKFRKILDEYLKLRGITVKKFCEDCYMPDGGKVHYGTVYRLLNKKTKSLTERLKSALLSNSDFENYVREKETAVTEEMERQYAIKVLNVINDIKQGERAKVLRRAITMNSI